MAFDDLVFMPREPDHNEVEDGEEDQKERMRIGISMYLIRDEKNKDDDRRGIRPEFSLEKTDCKEYLHYAVTQEIEGGKELRVL